MLKELHHPEFPRVLHLFLNLTMVIMTSEDLDHFSSDIFFICCLESTWFMSPTVTKIPQNIMEKEAKREV